MGALDRRPELPQTLEWVWAGFAALARSRSWIMGQPQPISLTELLAYAELEGLSRNETQELLGHVRKMDEIYIEHVVTKLKQEAKKRG